LNIIIKHQCVWVWSESVD